MTLLWLCICWVFAAALVAMLPMRRQHVPGLALMLAAPVLIALVWDAAGWLAGLAAAAAFVSMFRNPLRYLWARALGRNPEVPR